MDRRTFLAGLATIVPASVSGCLGFSGGEREGVVLTHVELGNATDEPQLFDVLVFHNDEILHWATHDVGVGTADGEAGGVVVDIDAPNEGGSVEIHVRVGERWRSTDFSTGDYEGEPVIAVVTYGMIEDDMLRISRRRSDRAASSRD